MDWEEDTQTALQFIKAHTLCNEITALFKKGPPANRGWMFLTNESPAFIAIEQKVLEMGYDSSGYAIMMRRIESAIKTHGSTPWKDQLPPTVAKAQAPQVPIENEFTAPMAVNKPMVMDEANKTALNILTTEGSAAAMKHMLFDQCNGDYSMMRSMYG